MTTDRRIKHGMAKSPEYRAWLHMLDRCNNPRSQMYYAYGMRGILVCERWNSFENFYADVGQRPSKWHSLDRIDNEGNYEPDNCKWSMRAEQNRNKRTNVRVIVDGEEVVLADAMKAYQIFPHGLHYRIKKFGESHQEAVNHYVNLRKLQWQS